MDKQSKKKTDKSLSKSKQPKEKKSTSKSKDMEVSANQKSIKSAKKGKEKEKTKQHKQSKQPKSPPALEKSISDISMIAPPVETLCELHRGTFVYYCETCEELVCNQCITLGPHNNQYHRIIKMNDAYKQRVFGMSQCFRLSLISKRDKLIQQLQKYERQIEEVRNYKHSIQREIRCQYGGHLQKLKLSEGSKSALLLYQISTIQKQINGINEMGTKFYQMTNTSSIPSGEQPEKYICKFLLKSKKLYDAVEYYLNKPLRSFPEVDVSDLPKELQNQRQLLASTSSTPFLNQFRDEVIWRLTNKEQSLKRDFQVKADSLIRNLSEEAQFLNNRLKQYNLGCVFCGQPLGENVNNGCSNNYSSEISVSGMQVARQRIGNGRHYFSQTQNDHLKKSIET